MPISLNRLFVRLSVTILFLFAFTLSYGQTPTPTATPAVTATPVPTASPGNTAVNCNDSEERAKQCVDAVVASVSRIKTSSESYVGLLKAEQKVSADLEKKYNAVRDRTNRVVSLLLKKNPDFALIKTSMGLASSSHQIFANDANIALEGVPPGSLDIFDTISALIFDNICRLVPGPPGTQILCNWVMSYIKSTVKRNSLELKQWNRIKALT